MSQQENNNLATLFESFKQVYTEMPYLTEDGEQTLIIPANYEN
jgi:hypothetical protein